MEGKAVKQIRSEVLKMQLFLIFDDLSMPGWTPEEAGRLEIQVFGPLRSVLLVALILPQSINPVKPKPRGPSQGGRAFS